jgi:F-type H+-transporting ATPase subunit b
MPQLNFADYPPQLIWLAITFVVLYLVLSRLALPRVGAALTAREAKLTGDLDRAEKLKAEAEATIAAYHKKIAEARAESQAELKQAAAAMVAEASRREAAFAAEIGTRTKTAEAGIAAAKAAALADLRTVAGDTARSLVARLSGNEPDAAAVEHALAAAEGVRH